ncbi:MAG TPA: SNF2-related protein [Acidimicrobiales bacterium]|nr:SNF2-related protein [Acidimicrobiales bacterium]
MAAVDEVVLERLVGQPTYDRGREYARHGAVRRSTWSLGGTRVVGEVQGGARDPYYASVELIRGSNQRLMSFEASCTCPVGFNCKHAVALVLAGELDASQGRRRLRGQPEDGPEPASRSGRNGIGRRSPGPPATAAEGWEGPLLDVLATAEDDTDDNGSAGIGLQFELVMVPSSQSTRSRTGRGTGIGGPGIRVRPVLPGRSGNWVKTGVSWSNLEYLSYGRARNPRVGEQIALAQELLALSRLSTRQTRYSYHDDVVWLEAINSRRLWDLLGEARDRGLPLIQAGRRADPVTIHSIPATVTLDVSRSDLGLRLQAQVTVDDEPVPLASSVLIGTPVHGIAWWDEPTAATGGASHLDLASFAAPVDVGLRDLLDMAVIDVPSQDEDRFLHGLLPTLRRRVPVLTKDPSVELPEDAPATLVLDVHYLGDHRIDVVWSWGTEGSEWREPLRGIRGGHHDRRFDDGLVQTVTEAAWSVDELLEYTATGPRLAAEAGLAGMSAVRFVTEVLPVLSELDRVVVHSVDQVPEYREEVEAPVVSLGGSSSTDNDWFDLTVSVTVGGEEVPFADLFVALAEDQSHLILPSGTYFSLDRDELRELARLIAEARALLDTTSDGIRLSRFQASLWEDLQRLGVVTAQAGAWQESVRALIEAADRTEYDAPVGLHATLRPYQHTGFNWLAYLYEHRLGGILADDMGLGKTLEALALMCHTRERGLTDAPYLVVAPTSVVGNWAAECRRFAPDLRAVTVTETARRRGTALADLAEKADLVITSYSLFRIEYGEYEAVEWAGLFLDEAQFAKNRQSQAYQRARLLPVPFKVCMTGTPIENNLMELWSLLSIAAPGLFVSPDRFAQHYRVPIERQGDAERLAQLRRRIRPLMLRRTKEQVEADLPDKQEQVLELELAPRHKRVYQTHLQRERQKVLGLLGDMTKNRMAIFRSLTLLRQASLDVSLIDAAYEGVPSTKLDALMEMLEDIVEDGHRVLVFSQFTRFLTMARRRIEAAGIDLCYLDGRTRKRDAVIDTFRTGDAPVFLISLKAGGFGLNLTEADYCILLDPWWNPATEAQAVDRVHRIGQTRKVMVYRLVAQDTIEEKVMALKARKSALFADVMDAGGLESGALTAADIRDLLE